jgi:hypothetical protein
MKQHDPNDPKGLIRESFAIEGITAAECRSIFLDWALSAPEGMEPLPMIEALLVTYGDEGHPMTTVLRDGLMVSVTPKRRGGRSARLLQN